MSKQKELENVVGQLRSAVPDITGVIVASSDGLSLAGDLPEGELARAAAMTATAASLGRRITDTLELGSAEEFAVKGQQGYLLVYRAGDKAVIGVAARAGANIGLINLEVRSATEKIAAVLG